MFILSILPPTLLYFSLSAPRNYRFRLSPLSLNLPSPSSSSFSSTLTPPSSVTEHDCQSVLVCGITQPHLLTCLLKPSKHFFPSTFFSVHHRISPITCYFFSETRSHERLLRLMMSTVPSVGNALLSAQAHYCAVSFFYLFFLPLPLDKRKQ